MKQAKNRKSYDFEMQALEAEQAEEKLRQLISNVSTKKFELKTERKMWHDTGNIVVEYESYNKPSGIAATEAEFWVHELRSQENETLVYLMFPTNILRKICNDLMEEGTWRRGGENKKMEMIPIKLKDILCYLQNFSGKGDVEFLTRKQRKEAI